ncbi:2-oxoglutarate dehydrogenase, E2 component, dihydrolipoamide succinyltransferase [Natronosporangium hydrolyticum]|uniref:Dihydrolipoamide acetyltransferase component of pyruvate dehydrogenase complex n=1 Tax=Natronosporangium hydrolyticum TaxID=2811111 RepID=A0A895YJL5_9ACTN|nr:2-oxoglutarate dehydrogenase, E2 component, dihydrolipoamide succinyltransferase [Natronosporangium hydrolyticum]QSB16195.1 2-oxoglutarate dehydrogenase, E2 component, dihydrolipoamide succinyltransferase [Natronosporangium hydrolyticum]
MPESVKMPALGESVTEGTVTRWLKNEGDRVEADEPLLEVSTDKVDTEIPSPAAGVVSQILVPVDEVAEVGAELAIINGEGDGGAQGGQAQPAAEAPAEAPAAEPAPAETGGAPAASGTDASPAGQAAAAAKEAAATTDAGTEVKLPALGESVTEGTITRWLKNEGDQVEADEPLLEISTDKVDTEIPSPAAGILQEIRIGEDQVAEVGSVLAVIGGDAGGRAEAPAAQAEPASQPAAEAAPAPEPAPAQPAQPQPSAAQPAPAQPAPAQPAPAQRQTAPAGDGATPAGEGGGYVTPLVRKLAGEHGVDLNTVSGTGVGGRIRKQDVLAAAEAKRAEQQPAQAASAAAPSTAAETSPQPKPEPSPLRGRTEKLSRMRALIARRMVESLQVSAQLTTVVEVDVTRISRLRERAKQSFQSTHGVKLTFLPFFALAVVEALRVHPNVNASIDLEAGTVTYHDAEHLGLAVDTERGLIVPVIRDAGDLSLAGLARRIADVAGRTRDNKVNPDELSGGTFTITNTGSRGALIDTPIINQPQVAILGTGTVNKRAVVVDDPNLGEIIIPRSMIYLSLSYDHRLVDGADAARFLTTLKDRLEAGNFESELGLA